MSELMILIGSFIILTSFVSLTSATKTRARVYEMLRSPVVNSGRKKEKAPKPDSYQP